MKKHEKEDRLLKYANQQCGYFTAMQAAKAGYAYRSHTYHVQAGNWDRVARGTFRLRNYPNTEREDLILWTLWSRNKKDEPQAVMSHETALSLYEIGDVMPSQIHLTVLPNFKKKKAQGCVLHRHRLQPNEIEKREGYSITTPLRTIIDIAESQTSEDELRKALQDGLDKGLFRLREINVSKMPQKGKMRMLMAIKALEETKR